MWIQRATPYGWSEVQDVHPQIAVAMINGGTARAVKPEEQREFAAKVTRAAETTVKNVKGFVKRVENAWEKFADFGMAD